MCTNPATHEGKTFACRKCWQCNENRIQDWVGRCIAETKTSTTTLYGTLTYGRVNGSPDHERATVLTYSDLQKCFKRVRRAGFKFKYLAAGEFGGLKGRTHWHVLLFFQGPAPKVAMRTKKWTWEFWDHGFSYWDTVTVRSAKYVCKYMRKNEKDEESQSMWRMSKVPPIGAEYFLDLAKRQVAAGLSPQNLIYRFPENRDKDRREVKHHLHATMANLYLDAFMDEWRSVHGNDDWPFSPLLRDRSDPSSRREDTSIRKWLNRANINMPRENVFLRKNDLHAYLEHEGRRYRLTANPTTTVPRRTPENTHFYRELRDALTEGFPLWHELQEVGPPVLLLPSDPLSRALHRKLLDSRKHPDNRPLNGSVTRSQAREHQSRKGRPRALKGDL